MKQETIDFIIETIKKYWEHYSKEDHGWCLTMPIIHKQALSDAIGELNKLKLKEPPEPEGECNQCLRQYTDGEWCPDCKWYRPSTNDHFRQK